MNGKGASLVAVDEALISASRKVAPRLSDGVMPLKALSGWPVDCLLSLAVSYDVDNTSSRVMVMVM